MGDDLRQAEFDARYRSLLAQYLAELPQRREAAASLWLVARRGATSPAWDELHLLVHRLAGSAPCYDLEAVGEAAQELDRLLSQKPPRREPAQLRAPVSRLLKTLDAAIAARKPRVAHIA